MYEPAVVPPVVPPGPVPPPELWLLPPQDAMPQASTRIAVACSTLRGLSDLLKRVAHSNSAVRTTENSNPSGSLGKRESGTTIVGATVAIVSVEVAAWVPSNVNDAGFGVQVTIAGSVPQLSATAKFAPPDGVIVIVEVPEAPAASDKVLGAKAMVKSGVELPPLTVCVNPDEFAGA